MNEVETDPPLSTKLQRFGAMVACDRQLDKITHVSDTIAGVMGRAPHDLLGSPLAAVMPRNFVHKLRNVMSLRHFVENRHFTGCYDFALGAQDVSVSQSAASGHVVIEFETAAESHHSADDFSAELSHLSAQLRSAADDSELLKVLAVLLRFATGYDSALVYRFGPDGGKVVAEAGNAMKRKYIGDRLMYLENSPDLKTEINHPILHFTADAYQAPASILSSDGVCEGLDLSHCHLRGLSSIDVNALNEIGARAAVTLPIVMKSGFWGMVLLLSKEPHTPSRYVRQLCEALASVVGDRLEILEHSLELRSTMTSKKGASKQDLSGKTALVVEDNRLIASDLKLTLLELGFATVDVFVDEASALEHLEVARIDLGVLDINLGGTSTSFEVARKMEEDGVPFLFASGYGAASDLPDGLDHRPVVLKPASKRDLSARIDELFDVALVGLA